MNSRDNSQKTSSGSSKIREFDVLRAVSIILLLILHSEAIYIPIKGVSLEAVGSFMEAFFLGSFSFMAGYFADASFRKREKSFVPFIRSKFIRIYPPYLIALLLFVFILDYTLKDRDWLVYLLNMQFIFSPVYAKQLLTLWYVSVLVGYYAIFIVVFVHISSGKLLFIVTSIIFGLAYLINRMTGLIDGRFLEFLFIFTAGVYLSRNQMVFEWFFSSHMAFILTFAAIGLLFYWIVEAGEFTFYSWQNFLSIDIFIISWVLLWLRIFRTGIFNWGILSAISYASFFTYLYHRPIWRLITNFEGGLLNLDAAWIKLVPGSIIALVICYYLQRAYDLLTRRLNLVS